MRRINNLVSDAGLHARSTLLVPTTEPRPSASAGVADAGAGVGFAVPQAAAPATLVPRMVGGGADSGPDDEKLDDDGGNGAKKISLAGASGSSVLDSLAALNAQLASINRSNAALTNSMTSAAAVASSSARATQRARAQTVLEAELDDESRSDSSGLDDFESGLVDASVRAGPRLGGPSSVGVVKSNVQRRMAAAQNDMFGL